MNRSVSQRHEKQPLLTLKCCALIVRSQGQGEGMEATFDAAQFVAGYVYDK